MLQSLDLIDCYLITDLRVVIQSLNVIYGTIVTGVGVALCNECKVYIVILIRTLKATKNKIE